MPTVNQRSFAGGELAPALHPRADLVKYATGAKTLRNYYIMRTGGAQSRAGLEFVAEVKDSSKSTRIIPFVFNSDQTYVIEMGDEYFRFHRQGLQLTDLTLTITGVTNASPAVVSYTGTDPTSGQEVQIAGIVGAIGRYLNGRNFKIANVNGAANTFELQYMNGSNVDSTSMGAYTSGGTASRVYTLSSTYQEEDLFELRYVQSADVMSFANAAYPVRELSRSGHTNWAISTVTFGANLAAPTGLNVQASGSGGVATYNWQISVSAISPRYFEESIVAAGTAYTTLPGAHVEVTWNPVSGAGAYYVYLNKGSGNGLVGLTFEPFLDIPDITVVDPDYGKSSVTTVDPFTGADNYPTAIAYYQQRLCFANTNNAPETIWTSRTGSPKNLNTSYPFLASDAITFSMAGRQVNRVLHLLDLGRLVIFTASGEWVAEGGAAGQLAGAGSDNSGGGPEINLRQHSYNGCNRMPPLSVNGSAIYVQANGNIVRDLLFNLQVDGFDGDDLTLFATHLFDGYTLIDWAYQKTPHSIVWAVRSDGKLLSMTYIPKQQILAWCLHDTDGEFESICSVPEDNEDCIYVVVKRTINGATKRYIERMATRNFDTIEEAVLKDSALSYDGRVAALVEAGAVTSGTTMTLSGGTAWDSSEPLTLTSSTSWFTSSEVGNQIWLYGTDDTVIRFSILNYTSGTVVTGRAHKIVPVAMRSTALSTWSRAVDEITGLWHIENKAVSVLGDGRVVASPNNANYETVTVTNGAITLSRCHAVIHVGIPFIADLQTLDIESTEGTVADKKKLVQSVIIAVDETRGLWVGGKPPTDDDTDPLEHLTELKSRTNDSTESYDDPPALRSEKLEQTIKAEWNSNGRVFLRQVDPLPATILAISPSGWIPAGR
jgi:hypothetical protein